MPVNQYVEFVREWSKNNNLSYMCAVTDPRLKADYLKFKSGESYGEEMDFQPKPKKKKVEKEFEITPAKKKKIEKEFIEIIPAAKLKSVPKTTKENMKKIKDAMVALVEKYTGKLKDLAVKKSDMSVSAFKEQKQNLLQKIDDVIEKIINKQDTSSKELSDMLEMYIDELTLIYKKLDGLKDPIKKKVEAKAVSKSEKEESVEEKTQKLIAEREILKKELKQHREKKDKFNEKMNSMNDPSDAVLKQYMELIFKYGQIDQKIGDIQEKIYKLNGRYV